MASSHTFIGMLVAAGLIGVASWIGRRWGAGAGGWFVALPLISGPIVLTYALERGPAFARQACIGAMLATVSLSAFALVYAWMARRVAWVVCSASACVAFLASTWALQHLRAPMIGWTFVVACAVLAGALAVMPPGAQSVADRTGPAWDIPLRMILAAMLVGVLATVSQVVGPRVSGLLTPFPITSTILVAFIHHGEGSSSASQFLRGLLKGLFSFAVFVLVVGATVEHWSIALSFAVATIVTLVFHAGVWQWVRPHVVRVSPAINVHE